MTNEELVLEYLRLFCNKDINSIQTILTDDCHLDDWDNSAMNKESTLKIFKSIFNNINTISIIINEIHETPNSIICEMVLSADTQTFRVIDVIGIRNNLISYIRAYKS